MEYSDNYSKTSESVLQYYIDKPAVSGAAANANFYDANKSVSFKFWKKKQVKQLMVVQNMFKS